MAAVLPRVRMSVACRGPMPPHPQPRIVPYAQVPIAVRCPLSRRWHIVHWLDSKASFGDDRLHSQALEGQYRTYLNRYGSGAVIYWLGFVADLAGGEGGGGREHGSGGGASGGVWQGSGGGSGSDGGDVLLLERFPPPEDIRLLPC